MSLPIVIIHQGNTNYLPYCLHQAKYSNPNSRIFLVGDLKNKQYGSLVEHHHITRYLDGVKDFEQVYKHLSTNTYAFELLCFQRWIILKNFMVKNNLNDCLYIDSDVMIYSDITQEQKAFNQFDILFSGYKIYDFISPHCTFINCLSALEEFCRFLYRLYDDPSLFQLMENHFLKLASENQYGGACDMTALRNFVDHTDASIGYSSDVSSHDARYDSSMNWSEYRYEMKDEMKNIHLVNGQPYCKDLELGEDVRFSILHFQGEAKGRMQEFYTGKPFSLNPLLHKMTIFQSRVERRLKRTLNAQVSTEHMDAAKRKLVVSA